MYLTDREVARRFGVSRQTIWRWASGGNFPAPVKLMGATRWKIAEIEAWEARASVAPGRA